MGARIVVLSGSPRTKGNTAELVAAFVDGATGAGREVSVFNVAGMRIGGCLGCGHCVRNHGECVLEDDMRPVLDALRAADALVFASPVYFFGVTGQLKLAIDRCFPLRRAGTPVRRAVLLMTCGADSAEVAAPSIAMFRQICAHQQWEEAGIIIASNPRSYGEHGRRMDLERAGRLGACM